MHWIAPEILEMARGLSLPLIVAGAILAILLFFTGWWAHRFWIVLAATALAGVVGLAKGPSFHAQPLIAGLLLALAAGVLALPLVRVIAFVAGGMATWLAVQAFGPAAWQEPLICFLLGGLAGLFLFRWWTMVLTSFMAVLIAGHCGLLAADRLGKVDAVEIASQHHLLLNWCCAGATFMGVCIQFLLERRRIKRQARLAQAEPRRQERRPRYQEEPPSFWTFPWRGYRRAG